MTQCAHQQPPGSPPRSHLVRCGHAANQRGGPDRCGSPRPLRGAHGGGIRRGRDVLHPLLAHPRDPDGQPRPGQRVRGHPHDLRHRRAGGYPCPGATLLPARRGLRLPGTAPRGHSRRGHRRHGIGRRRRTGRAPVRRRGRRSGLRDPHRRRLPRRRSAGPRPGTGQVTGRVPDPSPPADDTLDPQASSPDESPHASPRDRQATQATTTAGALRLLSLTLVFLLLAVLFLSHGITSLPVLAADILGPAATILLVQLGTAAGRWLGGFAEPRLTRSSTILLAPALILAGGLTGVYGSTGFVVAASVVVLGAGIGTAQTVALHTAMRRTDPGRASVV